MGGSSVASTAFLHCFATPYVELGEHEDLAETVEYFAAGPRNSFNRESQAAGVSWNLRYVLGGRPASFRNELDLTQARWALVSVRGQRRPKRKRAGVRQAPGLLGRRARRDGRRPHPRRRTPKTKQLQGSLDQPLQRDHRSGRQALVTPLHRLPRRPQRAADAKAWPETACTRTSWGRAVCRLRAS